MNEQVPPATVVARAAWSRLAEPGDLAAGAVLAALGPVDALAWLHEAAAGGRRLESAPSTAGPATDGGGLGLGDLDPALATRLAVAVRRWVPRLATVDPERDIEVHRRLGGSLLVPEDPRWPTGLGDLQAAEPPCLWVRGERDLAELLDRGVALIGARACTSYGEHVTAGFGAGLADQGWTVVSGGAYGIDAVAHRAALAAGGRTAAFLAGGADRPYPAGNARLLAEIIDQGGAVVSEVPPGSVPSRSRFLQRNRLIAAVSRATVVVEAAWRSGALNTAGHAASLLRPVGAVPGPVTSAASAGCHRLLRDAVAVCVTDVAEVTELAGAFGRDLVPVRVGDARRGDDLPAVQRRTLDALPVRAGASVESVTRAAGLSVTETRAALGSLELAGLAVQDLGLWRRSRS